MNVFASNGFGGLPMNEVGFARLTEIMATHDELREIVVNSEVFARHRP